MQGKARSFMGPYVIIGRWNLQGQEVQTLFGKINLEKYQKGNLSKQKPLLNALLFYAL